MFLLIFFTVVITIAIYVLKRNQKRTFSVWKNKKVQGPEPSYFIGNIKNILLGKKFLGTYTADLYKQYNKEKYVGIYMASSPAILIKDLDIIKAILVKDYDNFNSRGLEFSEEGMGKNLFHSDGDTWSILRKRMTPMFTSGKLKKMLYLVKENAENYINYIGNEIVNDKEVSLTDLSGRYTINVICACAFGIEAKTLSNKYNMFMDYGSRIFKPTWRVMIETFFPGSLKRFGLSIFDKSTCDLAHKLVREKIANSQESLDTRHDFMDLLLEMKNEKVIFGNKIKSIGEISMEVTDALVAAQALTLFGGGYETTASSMAFLLHELAMYPEIQDKVTAEINNACTKFDGDISYEMIQDLIYTDMCISEITRKYPLVEPIQRKALSDYKLPGTDVTIPKGTLVFVSAKGIQMDPNYWPDPEKFEPERFSLEKINQRHPMSYLAFGEGPRYCIGGRFSRIVIKVGLVHFLRRFRVEPSEHTKQHVDYTPNRLIGQPLGGLYVTIKKRE